MSKPFVWSGLDHWKTTVEFGNSSAVRATTSSGTEE
jgi:hypothetical protein